MTVFNILEKKDKKIFIHSDAILAYSAGNTIMLSNWMNKLMENNNKIFLASIHKLHQNFKRNLIHENYDHLQFQSNDEIINFITNNFKKYHYFIIRNNSILSQLENKPFLDRTIIYSIDAEDISILKKIHRNLNQIITQSEFLKNRLIENNIDKDKIHIIEPFSYKFNITIKKKKNLNEINLIYAGTLRKEENIIEIINEFRIIRKINNNYKLKIIYGKIHGKPDFINQIHDLLNKNLDGIEFYHNLSYYDVCQHIANSDIGICWRKSSYDNNGQISTKIKDYELYGTNVITNNLNLDLNVPTLYFNQNNFKETILNFKNNMINNKNFNVAYLANSALPDLSGYTIRTKNILNVISKQFKILCFVKPPPKNKKKHLNIYNLNNVFYIRFPNRNYYEKELTKFLKDSEIKVIWSASDNYNGLLGSRLKRRLNLKSIYEIRGFWHYSRKYKEIHEKNSYDQDFFNKYDEKEMKSCINNDYILCENDIILNYCKTKFSIPSKKLNLLLNGTILDSTPSRPSLNTKKKIVFGYIGSIVSYEGLENLIDCFNRIDQSKYNCELLLIGGGHTNDAIKTIKSLKKQILNKKNIFYLGQIPHEHIHEYYQKIDIICLPRIDCEVCNMVSPLKPYEAMKNGNIVFASSVDAIKSIINHNENGILFDKKNIDDLYKKIMNILNNKYDLDKIVANSLDYCNHHTWEITCENAINILNQII